VSFWQIVSLILFLLLLVVAGIMLYMVVLLDRFIQEWDNFWLWRR
jgi:uncharacterized integral membrane protein